MEKILQDLEEALKAEPVQTSALNTAKALFGSLKERLAEHAKQSTPVADAKPAAPAPTAKA